MLTVAAAGVRSEGFTSAGLFRDDAWVALSARVGLGTAWHMWVSAPGFFFLERLFIEVGPAATWWAQIPPFVAGVLCVPSIYALARYFRATPLGGLASAALVCASPICVTYSTRVKEYPVDFLLTCALLATFEAARRSAGGRRHLAWCAAVSVAAFLFSASTAIVIIAGWSVLGVCVLQDRSRHARKTFAGLGAAGAAGCAVIAAVFYLQISPKLKLFWLENSGFMTRHPLSQFASSLEHTAWTLLSGLFGFGDFGSMARLAIIVVWLLLSAVGLSRDRALLVAGVAVLLAFAADLAQLLPLGTGRTDEYLYPVILLLPLAGLVRLLEAVAPWAEERARRMRRQVTVVLAAVVAVGSLVLIGRAATDVPAYPGVAVQALAAAIRQQEKPGDHIYVN
ncbi:MAG TPA: glycosyltransferase family 39 protein, partial [Acidimicrobiales bacterium]